MGRGESFEACSVPEGWPFRLSLFRQKTVKPDLRSRDLVYRVGRVPKSGGGRSARARGCVGDVKPHNFVFRGTRLVAVDFGSTCVEDSSEAKRKLGADADTSFTSIPSDQFASSIQYEAPERARHERRHHPCVARRSQDVWSLGMVLFFLSTGGTPYFTLPEERTDAAMSMFQEQTRWTLLDGNFSVDLKNVQESVWRCSIGRALITSDDERATASEVLEVFSRRIHGTQSVVSKTQGMDEISRKVNKVLELLASVDKRQEEVLKRAGAMSHNLELVLQTQNDLRRRVATMSTVLEHLATDETRMPHNFLVLPENRNLLRRPKQWFAKTGRLHFVCAHGLELVPCGKDGAGFLVSEPKKWVRKHATLLQATAMVILAAAAVAGAAASGGAAVPFASVLELPFEMMDLDDAYRFLSDAKVGMDHMLNDISISGALFSVEGKAGVLQSVKEVTGAEYRSVLDFLDKKFHGWDRQMGGMERALSADGIVGWVCPQHRSEWKSTDVKGASPTQRG